MNCPNCGKELLEGAKFCPDCGEKIESKKSEAVNAVAEEVETVEKETLDTVAQTEEPSAAPSQEKPEPVKPTSVNTVPPVATNPAPVNASFEISSNGKITSSKKGRTKFKDLSPKQKAIRFGIGGLLLLIGIIWIVSDGIKGSEKAGSDYADNSISDENENAGSDYSNNSISDENENAIKVIPCNCDTGAVFDMSLEEFSKSFDKYCKQYEEVEIDLNSLWGSPNVGTENSGTSYTLYMAKPYTDINFFAKVIDNHIAGITIGLDYTSDTYRDNISALFEIFSLCNLSFGRLSADEEQEMRKQLADGADNSKTRTSYICDGIKYTLGPDKLNSTIVGFTCSVEPVSREYVNSLTDNIIYNDFSDVKSDEKSVETGKQSATPIMSDEQAISALYYISAYPAGMEQAVEMGVYEDLSVGEVLDLMYQDPSINIEQGDNCVYVTVSGSYRYSASVSYYTQSGSITYKVDSNGKATLYDDPDGVKSVMEGFAVNYGAQ